MSWRQPQSGLARSYAARIPVPNKTLPATVERDLIILTTVAFLQRKGGDQSTS